MTEEEGVTCGGNNRVVRGVQVTKMLATWRKSTPLATHDSTFTLSMAVVIFVAVICEMTIPQPYHCGSTIDVPVVHSPSVMPHAAREDAMIITISRTGDVFCGRQLVRPEQLAPLIRKNVNSGSERKAYIRADSRTYYSNVKQVVDAVQAAGLVEISFLAEQGDARTNRR